MRLHNTNFTPSIAKYLSIARSPVRLPPLQKHHQFSPSLSAYPADVFVQLIRYIQRVDPSQQPNTQPASPPWDREKTKGRQDSDIEIMTVLCAAKVVRTNKSKRRIHSLLPMGRQIFSHLLRSRVSTSIKVVWEYKYHNQIHPSSLLLSPIF